MKKLLTILAAVFCIVSTTAYAGGFTDVTLSNINADNELTIFGTVSEEYADKDVAVMVYSPTKSFNDFEAEALGGSDFTQIVAFNDQTKILQDGTFQFVMELGEESGVYDIYLSGDIEGIGVVNKKVAFCSAEDAKTAIEMINNALNAEEIYSAVIMTEPYSHLFYIPTFEENGVSYSRENAADYLFALKQKQSFDAGKKNEFANTYSLIALMDALNSAGIDDISTYISLLDGTNHEKTFELFEYTAELGIGKAVADAVSNQSFSNTEDMLDKLGETVALEIISKTDAPGVVSKVLNTYKDEIGIAETDISNAICIQLKGQSYSGFSELKNVIEATGTISGSNSGSTGGNSGSSGNRGGSSGGSSGGFVSISDNYLEQVQNSVCGFNDVLKNAWYAQAVENLYNKKVISGRTADSFCPDEFVTREEFVKMAVVLFGIEQSDNALPFNDVNANAWFHNYISGAYAKGIINGISENTFGIGMSITRQDASVVLNNIFEKMNITASSVNAEKAFADDEKISSYAREAVYKMQTSGIINGYEDNTFLPANAITRAEAAKLLEAAMKISEGQAVIK